MATQKAEVPYGTLDLLILRSLKVMGPLHGYGLARRIEQGSGNILSLNQGSIYPALLRLQQKGWIKASWGESENKRRARYYSLTKKGAKQLEEEVKSWRKTSALIDRFLEEGA